MITIPIITDPVSWVNERYSFILLLHLISSGWCSLALDRSICPDLSAAVPTALAEGIKEKSDADISLFNRTWAFCLKLELHCWQGNLSWPRRYRDIRREKGLGNEMAKTGVILQPDLSLSFIANKKAEREIQRLLHQHCQGEERCPRWWTRGSGSHSDPISFAKQNIAETCVLSLPSGPPVLLCHLIVRVEISSHCHYK